MGRVVSTVLYETNGVITEERYQKMTPIQWQFQYASIMKRKSEDRKNYYTDSVLIQDILSRDIDALSMVINRDIAKQYIEIKEDERKNRQNRLLEESQSQDKKEKVENKNDNVNTLNINDEEALQEYMKKYYDAVPNTITIPAQVINANRYFLPKFNKDKLSKDRVRRHIDLDTDKNISSFAIKKTQQKDDISQIKIMPKASRKKKINLPGEGDDNGDR